VLAEIDLLAERQPRVEVLQRDGGAGERLNQDELNGTELIATAEIGLNSATSLSNAFAALVRPSSWARVSSCGRVALCWRRRFARLSGEQAGGNRAVSRFVSIFDIASLLSDAALPGAGHVGPTVRSA
jgi:hypothetical protein